MKVCNSLLVLLIGVFTSGCDTNPYKQGAMLYQTQCANCHMPDGEGLARLIPSLDSSEILKKGDGRKLICLIRRGVPKNPHTNQQMLPNRAMNAVELTNLTNYLFQRFSETADDVQLDQIREWEDACQLGEK